MRINHTRLRKVADHIFEQGGVISGTQIAKRMGLSKDTLWHNLRGRGMEPKQARLLAGALDKEATRLRAHARDLRAAASGD